MNLIWVSFYRVAALIDLTSNRVRIASIGVASVLGVCLAWGFIQRVWQLQPRNADVENLISYQAAEWLSENAHGSRVFVAGELSGALQVWADVRQAGGGTDQGASNPLMLAAHREVSRTCTGDPVLSEYWLRALACRYIVVHEASSKEHDHFYVKPDRFSRLETAWTNGAGDKILRLTAPDVQEAVVVDLTELDRLPALQSTEDVGFLRSYVAWAQGKRAAQLRWSDNHSAWIEAELQPNEAVLVKTNYDAGWEARGARIRSDPLGFMLLNLPPGRQSVELRYSSSWDRWLGLAISLSTVILLFARAPNYLVGPVAAVAALVGYTLVSGPSMHMLIAQDTFRRLQPPMISPAGIVDGVTFGAPPLVRGQTVSLFGRNFGSSSDRVRVMLDERETEILYRSATQINFRLPDDAPADLDISVEVNGCGGNAFAVPTRTR
jgi:hypothetical protein